MRVKKPGLLHFDILTSIKMYNIFSRFGRHTSFICLKLVAEFSTDPIGLNCVLVQFFQMNIVVYSAILAFKNLSSYYTRKDTTIRIVNESKLLKIQEEPKSELEQLKQIKHAVELHIQFSVTYRKLLRSLSHPSDSNKNLSPWKSLKEGSYYLLNVYRLVSTYYSCPLVSMHNESIKSIKDLLVELEFHPGHISSGYTKEAYGGKAKCFVSKGQGTKYYEMLHSELKRDITSFIEMVELKIDIPIKKFYASIKERLQCAYPNVYIINHFPEYTELWPEKISNSLVKEE